MEDAHAAAERFARQFPAVYLRFHRRDAKMAGLTAASRAVLEHLALAGPVTVGELSAHLDRSQSVASDIVSHLEDAGLRETSTLAYMATLPAWRDHPRVIAANS